MTVLAKPSLNSMKPDEMQSPLVRDAEQGVRRTALPPTTWRAPKRSTGALLFMSIVAVLVAITGVTCGLMLYRQYLRSTGHRYQAYCSIPYDAREELPMPDQLIEHNMHAVIPLRWFRNNPDVQFISTNGRENEDMMNSLREEFDIRGGFESIKVTENGRQISFVHDFEGNVSGIVDAKRCFQMDLDPEVVLPPERLMLGIEQDQPFDVSPVRSVQRVILPALVQKAIKLAECLNKPTYRLEKQDGVIRKRSVEAPAHDYVHFAGQKVQEIEIANMNDLIAYEQNNAK